jgi:Transposase DDE domain
MREMLDSASPCAPPFEDWMGRILDLLGDFDLEAAARSTKALVRRRGVKSVRALLHLALARGPGGLSLRETAAWAHLAGVAELNDGSLNDRLHQSCDFLKAIVEAMLRARNAEAPARWSGRSVRFADGTCISKPGGKSGASSTDWRIHAVYDLGMGGFSHLEITDAHGGEAIDRGAPAEGEIRIADRGFANAKALRRFVEAGKKGLGRVPPDFIVRLRWNACKLADRDGKAFDLIERLRSLPPDCQIDQVGVNILGAGKPLPARLIIRRKAPEHVAAEITRLRRMAAKHKRELDPRSLVAAEFVVVATSLDEEAYPASEVLALYRLRWQIELAFKRLKSLLHIDELPARSERGGLSWLYAHLILALTVEAEAQDLLDSFPSGPCRGELHQVAMAGL